MAQSHTRTDGEAFDYHTDGSIVPGRGSRDLARTLRSLDAVRRVSWLSSLGEIYVHADAITPEVIEAIRDAGRTFSPSSGVNADIKSDRSGGLLFRIEGAGGIGE